jgi:hypothetical protein
MMDLDPFTEAVLTRTLQTVTAREQLENPSYAGMLDAEQFYELCVRAGYDEQTSQKAANHRANARLDKGLTA